MTKTKALSITKKTLWITFLVIFAIMAIIAFWLMFDKLVLGSPAPSIFGYSSLTVTTGSMQGTINSGDLILIKDQDEYKIGDIVTFIHEGQKVPTTHRIIFKNSDGSFITKGDANNTQDKLPVTNDEILGEVIDVYPNWGIFTTWIRTEGWIYIVACLAILGLGFFILNSSDDKKKSAANTEKSEPTTEGAQKSESESANNETKPSEMAEAVHSDEKGEESSDSNDKKENQI